MRLMTMIMMMIITMTVMMIIIITMMTIMNVNTRLESISGALHQDHLAEPCGIF